MLAAVPPAPVPERKTAPRAHTKRGAHLFKCKATPGGLCGTLEVPLDRTDPSHGKVRLFFQYYPHTAKGRANEAIMLSEGGPGYSVTETQFESPFYHDTFAPLLKHRDLIMLDQRGVGRSDAIDCKGLQHRAEYGSSAIVRRVQGCAQQLGGKASLYGSGSVALDMEAVRRALGIQKLDLYGGSYAAQDVQSYALRYPRHVRVAVLDSPFSASLFDSPDSPLDVFGTDLAAAGPRVADLLCSRSQSCSEERPDAHDDIAWLAQRLRNQPLVGTGTDAEGNRHQVRVTEGFLGWNILQSDAGGYAAPNEIAAAAASLRAGDAVPLLRLAAENASESGDSGPAKVFSDGDNSARVCTDESRLPWSKSASVKQRFAQYRQAKSALPANQFGPFSVDGWLARPPSPLGPDPCIGWAKPKGRVPAAVPSQAKFPANVPALVITGDIDLSIPPADSKPLTQLWPNSDYVEIEDAGHHTFFQAMSCADPIIVHFIADRTPGDTSCAQHFGDRDQNSLPGVGRFPVTAAGAVEATPASGDQSTATDRKVATVATAAVTDAIQRGFMQQEPTKGVGLRGGTFKPSFNQSNIAVKLSGARFASDVAVSGTAKYLFSSQAINAPVTVDGPGGEDGALTVKGVWFGFGVPTTVLRVTGTLGGRNVSVTVPAS